MRTSDMIAVARVDAALQAFELGSKRNALLLIGAGKGSLRLFEAGDETAVFFKTLRSWQKRRCLPIPARRFEEDSRS